MDYKMRSNSLVAVVFGLFMILGALSITVATPASIIMAIYSWGALDLALGASMWAGALLWLKLFIGGWIVAMIGYIGSVE